MSSPSPARLRNNHSALFYPPRTMHPRGDGIMDIPDYYEFLQISPSAEPDTIHRVYRFLAARFHPDNQDTGDAEKFFLLKQAYDVLANPEGRAAYDATRRTGITQ